MTLLLTGASGYIGGFFAQFFRAKGAAVRSLGRSPQADVHFVLGSPVDSQLLAGADALIHCAYDFRPSTLEESVRMNAQGTKQLFEAAAQAGVGTLIFVSSLSAFPAARSIYGKTKLACEQAVAPLGAISIRPGVVYGGPGGGISAAVEKLAQKLPVVPIVGGSSMRLFYTNVEDLARCIETLIQTPDPYRGQSIVAAYPKSYSLGDFVAARLRSQGKKQPLSIPVPLGLTFAGLRAIEALRLPAPLRSDSVTGLIYRAPEESVVVPEPLRPLFRDLT